MNLTAPRSLLTALVISLGCWSAAALSPVWAADYANETPAWAKEHLPDWVAPFVGRPALSGRWTQGAKQFTGGVVGLDLWQANHFIVYRPETAKYLYSEYTPLKVEYRKGLFPSLEKIVARYTKPGQSDREKALALLTKAMAKHMPHPTVPPIRKFVGPDRGLDDEGLFASGSGWCNQQARGFVRLCQIAGVPARIIELFFANERSGHVVSEFYADGHWCMADSS